MASRPDKMMLATCSLMWFTALRAGHFSPQDLTGGGRKHLLQWAHVHPYDAVSFAVPRPAAHFIVPSSKSSQAEAASTFTTATCCICEGAAGDAKERRDLRLLCPVHALERWRRVAPGRSRYVCCDPASSRRRRDDSSRRTSTHTYSREYTCHTWTQRHLFWNLMGLDCI